MPLDDRELTPEQIMELAKQIHDSISPTFNRVVDEINRTAQSLLIGIQPTEKALQDIARLSPEDIAKLLTEAIESDRQRAVQAYLSLPTRFERVAGEDDGEV